MVCLIWTKFVSTKSKKISSEIWILKSKMAAILKKATVGEKQLYLNNQSPKYNNLGVYLHIIWVKEVNSDEM